MACHARGLGGRAVRVDGDVVTGLGTRLGADVTLVALHEEPTAARRVRETGEPGAAHRLVLVAAVPALQEVEEPGATAGREVAREARGRALEAAVHEPVRDRVVARLVDVDVRRPEERVGRCVRGQCSVERVARRVLRRSAHRAQTSIPNSFAALPRVIASMSASGTPSNCLSIHSWEYGNDPSGCG